MCSSDLDNVTINVTVTGAENVWVIIWEGVVGVSNVLYQGFLSLISGNLWSIVVPTNASFAVGDVNYTIYANDSANNVINLTSNFSSEDNFLSIEFTEPPTPVNDTKTDRKSVV